MAKNKEANKPTEKRINGQLCDRVDSPLDEFPGHIWVVRNMSPAQFQQYWQRLQESPPDAKERMMFVGDYYLRQHLVAEWCVEGVDDTTVADETGMSLPAVELINFVVAATMPTVKRAMNLPNLPGWWPNTTPIATSEDGTADQTPTS